MAGKNWTVEDLVQLARAYQPACVIGAAAELDLFAKMGTLSFTAEEAAERLAADLRGISTLLDALAALELLQKDSDRYTVPETASVLLNGSHPGNQLGLIRHQLNCLRRWSKLAHVVKTGEAAPFDVSILGEKADYESFIEAMDNVSKPVADKVIGESNLPAFSLLLDIGGGSGTWTIAFLQAEPGAKAIIFDLPQVRTQAEDRIKRAGYAERVSFVAGDYYTDALPKGADLAWLSAIVHQNSREQNRSLFSRVHQALQPGGVIAIRDMVMEPSRTRPVMGALFAVNMLVGTRHGGTFTFEELRDDLSASGFSGVALARRDEGMHSVITGRK